MKDCQEIFNKIVEDINKKDKENYLEYYSIFLKYKDMNNMPTDEKEKIVNAAYKRYKDKEKELENIYADAYLDLMKGLR